MRKQLLFLILILIVQALPAEETLLCDFSRYEVGVSFDMRDIYSNNTDSYAHIVANPIDAESNVLHVTNKSWNTFVGFALPEGVTGSNLYEKYQSVVFKIYRPHSDANDYMQMAVLLGNDILYWDSGYPYQGDRGQWHECEYFFENVANDAKVIYIGFNNNSAEYYIDNIRLKGISQSEIVTLKWTGSVSDIWDEGTDKNFVKSDDNQISSEPVCFQSGSRVLFDDMVENDRHNIKVKGKIEVSEIDFENNSLGYTITGEGTDAILSGTGQLNIYGGGSVTLDVENRMNKGTYIQSGRLKKGSVNGPDPFGYNIIAENAVVDFSFNTSEYVTVNTPIKVVDGGSIDVYTSRYGYWMSPLVGNGTVNVYSGGERSYLGSTKGEQYPDWTHFKGTVNLYQCKDVIATSGFYGLVLGHGGKTFNPEETQQSIASGKVNETFTDNVLVMHENTTLACESGTRGFRIGELQMAPSSRICGYFKASNPKSYFIVGSLNTDATLAGRIAPADKNGIPYIEQTLGLIKEGSGTYVISNNNNMITGGIRVLDGKLLINNDVYEAENNGLTGGTGYCASGTQIFVFEKAIIGGTGNIAGDVDVYGKLEPGNEGIGTLRLQNFAKSKPVSLYLRPTSVLEFEIESADKFDRLIVDNELMYYNILEDFTESDKKPVIRIVLDKDYEYKDGDEFILIQAKRKNSLYGDPWQFDAELPSDGSWVIEERITENEYSLVLKRSVADGLTDKMATTGQSVFVKDNRLFIKSDAPQKVLIFDECGSVLNSFSIEEGVTELPAPKGIIIIKAGEYYHRVVN